MALSARVPDGSDLTSLCRHKLEGIFDMHGVRTGSRADVPGFLEKLYGDRYFAMDFWALVESLEGVRDRISEEQIRRTVAECVCGWVPRGDPALTGIEEAFDARAASRAPSTPPAADAPFEPGLRIVEHLEGPPASMADHADSYLAANPAYSVERTSSVVELGAASGSLGKIDQILSRLELNDHELKLLLESIESRISRLEPHVEQLTSQVVRKQRPVATSTGHASTGQTIARYSRQTVDRAGRQLAATNVAVGSWGTRLFRRMDIGLEKTGQGFAAMHVLVKLWGRKVKRQADPALARLAQAGTRGRVAVASATSAAASGLVKCRAAARDWVEQHRAMLVHVSTTLGVVACLALIVWLWGRPRGYMVKATPVAASSNAAAPAPVAPAPVAPAPVAPAAVPTAAAATKPDAEKPGAENPDVQSAQEPIDHAPAASSTQMTAPPEQAEPAVATASGVQGLAAKVNVEKAGSYTAAPWIKWYSEDGKEQPTEAAALGAKTQAPATVKSASPSDGSTPAAKRQTQ